MGLFQKLFGSSNPKTDVYPDVPEGMKGVFMKGVGNASHFRKSPQWLPRWDCC
jgi:hypothetical protein